MVTDWLPDQMIGAGNLAGVGDEVTTTRGRRQMLQRAVDVHFGRLTDGVLHDIGRDHWRFTLSFCGQYVGCNDQGQRSCRACQGHQRARS